MKALLVVSLAALIAGCTGKTDVPGPSPANPLDQQEIDVFGQINALRASSGLVAFTQCKMLNITASAHSDDMRALDYLSDTAPDGSTPRQRACKAGYLAACQQTTSMAELVASGNAAGTDVFTQWTGDPKTMQILVDPTLIVAGIGRAIGGMAPVWTLDMASVNEASCLF